MELKDELEIKDLNVGKDDLVNIAVATYEESLDNDMAEYDHERELLFDKMHELEEARDSKAEKELNDNYSKKIKKACDAMNEVGVVLKPKISFTGIMNKKNIEYLIKFNVDSNTKDWNHSSLKDTLLVKGEIKITKELASIIEELYKTNEKINKLTTEIERCGNKLKNMDKTIRKAKARLTCNLVGDYSDFKVIIKDLIESVMSGQKKLR